MLYSNAFYNNKINNFASSQKACGGYFSWLKILSTLIGHLEYSGHMTRVLRMGTLEYLKWMTRLLKIIDESNQEYWSKKEISVTIFE